MANQYNAGTPTKVRTLFNAIRSALTISGTALDVDFADAPGFSMTISVNPDGQTVTVTTKPDGAGLNNRFGTADPAGRLTRAPAKIIDSSTLP